MVPGVPPLCLSPCIGLAHPGCAHDIMAPSQSGRRHVSFRVHGDSLNFILEYHNNQNGNPCPDCMFTIACLIRPRTIIFLPPHTQPFIGPGKAPRNGPDSRVLLQNTSAGGVHIWFERGSTEMNSPQEYHADSASGLGGLKVAFARPDT
jgi:hypothetical protein